MIEFSYTIKDPKGIHARPAGAITAVANKYNSHVTLWVEDKNYDIKKLLTFMGSGLKYDDTFVICVEGPDENECKEELVKVISENL